jgi:hypothetical protein
MGTVWCERAGDDGKKDPQQGVQHQGKKQKHSSEKKVCERRTPSRFKKLWIGVQGHYALSTRNQ